MSDCLSRVLFSAKSDNWSTPNDVYNTLDKEFGFDFDPCPLGDNIGFVSEWGKRVFCNPPYSDIRRFLDKALLELRGGRSEVVVFLVPSRTDTRWWHEVVAPYSHQVRFIKGRLKFGNSKNSAPFPSVVIVFTKESAGVCE